MCESVSLVENCMQVGGEVKRVWTCSSVYTTKCMQLCKMFTVSNSIHPLASTHKHCISACLCINTLSLAFDSNGYYNISAFTVIKGKKQNQNTQKQAKLMQMWGIRNSGTRWQIDLHFFAWKKYQQADYKNSWHTYDYISHT